MASTDNSAALRYVDSYLKLWRKLSKARFKFVIIRTLKKIKARDEKFKDSLAHLIISRDRRAMPRFVYYMIVQGAAHLPILSRIGKAVGPATDNEIPFFHNGVRNEYFSGDVYHWYLQNRDEFEPFALIDEWEDSAPARDRFIPQYESTVAERGIMAPGRQKVGSAR